MYLKKNLNASKPFEGELSKCLGGDIGCKDEKKLFMIINRGSPMVVTYGRQYHVEEKATVILYTLINRHAGTPEKQ